MADERENDRYSLPVPQDTLPFTGERFVPGVGDQIEHEHVHRYLFSLQFCNGRDVLDVACGEGYGSALLGGVAKSVVGVDSSADAVAHASRNYASQSVAFVQADATETPLADASVDVVVCFETIEHVDDHEGLLGEIKRVLRPDGLLLLSTPDRETYLAGAEPNPYHVRELNRVELAALVSSHFAHVAVGGQDSSSGSAIFVPNDAERSGVPTYFDKIDADRYTASAGPARPTYLISLASDVPLPGLAPSVLSDVRHVPGLHRSYRAELDRVWEEVATRDNGIAELTNQTTTLGSQLQAAQVRTEEAERERVRLLEEVGRLGDQLVAASAELENVRDRLVAAEREAEHRLVESHALERQLDHVEKELSAAYASFSWKLTAPLREGKAGVRRALGRLRRVVRLRTRLRALRSGLAGHEDDVEPSEPESSALLDLDEQSLPRDVWDDRIEHAASSWAARHSARATARSLSFRPLVSILLPTYETPVDVLELTIRSVQAQTYDRWELLVVDDGSTSDELRAYLADLPQLDQRIRVSREPVNRGISAATNAALAVAVGDLVAMLDHDDELLPHALTQVVQAFHNDPSVDVVYTDQEYIDADGTPSGTLLKPDWSPRLFWGVMFVGHLLVVRREVAVAAKGFDSSFDNVQDFEFMLRLSERTTRIGHVPEILYRWRRLPGSVAFQGDAKTGIEALQARAVTKHLARLGVPAAARPHPTHAHRATVVPQPHAPVSVTVLVNGDARHGATPVSDRHELVVIGDRAASRGASPAAHRTDYVAAVDADLDLTEPDWLESLLLYADLPDVGVVAPLILAADGSVEQSGLIVGRGAWFRAMEGWDPASDGYAGSLSCAREVTAIGGACALVSAAKLMELGGFSGALQEAEYAWLELSLRASEAGLRNIVTPGTVAQRTTPSKGGGTSTIDRSLVLDRWAPCLRTDRFHNRNFTVKRGGYTAAGAGTS